MKAEKQTHYLNNHFDLFGNGEFIYVYIYKNACSVFKKIIKDYAVCLDKEKLSDIEIMRTRRVSLGEAEAAKIRLFVVRDPIERVVSGFLNQVMSKFDRSYPEMFDGIARAAGKPLCDITFRDFVTKYLGGEQWRDVNAHFSPVSSMLGPLYYDAVIDMDDLRDASSILFGDVISDKYFSRKINATSNNPSQDTKGLVDTKLVELHKNFLSTRKYPDKKCFYDADIYEKLNNIYEKDVYLYDQIKHKKNIDSKIAVYDNQAKENSLG